MTGIASALVEGAASYCGRAALFIHKGDQLLGFRAAGAVSGDVQLEFQRLTATTSDAPAIARAVSSLQAVDANGSASELSQAVVDLLGLSDDDQVRLFPVALRDKALAVLYCDGLGSESETPVVQSAVEVLVSLAEAWIEAVGTRRKQTAA